MVDTVSFCWYVNLQNGERICFLTIKEKNVRAISYLPAVNSRNSTNYVALDPSLENQISTAFSKFQRSLRHRSSARGGAG